ncbi:TetR/AcrR family transcriptional regulator [Mycolicibacterium sp. 22603]|uniref:TetR/AcrR family transcriptional regulator n=1 Tax=Mycolicibacterium sp. 22603 TaxID=3453950 RepID=UPI003F857ACA
MTVSSSDRKGDARERLLATLLDVFGDDFPSPDMSLREIADHADTSHALLRYHFGSLSGVLAAMLTARRSRDNRALKKAAEEGGFDDLVAAIWRAYTRPGQLSRTRGFFHVAALAAYRPGEFGEFIDSLDDLTEMLASAAEREGSGTERALDMATVAVGALRGMLLHQVLHPAQPSAGSVRLIVDMSRGLARG